MLLNNQKLITPDGAELSSFEGESVYANSNGLIAKLKNTKHTLFCSLIAKRDDEMQTAYEYGVALDANDLTSATQVGLGAAKLAQDKLGSRHLSPQKCPIIYTPRQSSSLFSQLLGALSGSRQYKKTSFLLDSLDKEVLPKTVSVYEDPLQLKTLGARAFDQDGVLKKKPVFYRKRKGCKLYHGSIFCQPIRLRINGECGWCK